jgi:hypothetical protein
MGTQVAVKELVSLQDKAKDEVCRRKGRTAKQEKHKGQGRSRRQQQAQLHTHREEEEQSSDSSDTDRCVTASFFAVLLPLLLLPVGAYAYAVVCHRAHVSAVSAHASHDCGES